MAPIFRVVNICPCAAISREGALAITFVALSIRYLVQQSVFANKLVQPAISAYDAGIVTLDVVVSFRPDSRELLERCGAAG